MNEQFWKKVFADHAEGDISRRKIIGESLSAQHLAKQVIFDLQRGNFAEATEKYEKSLEGLKSLQDRFGNDQRLRNEGSWKASIEEFVEAKLFMDFCLNKELTAVSELKIETEEYLGGLSDTTGEIVRLMVIWTIKDDYQNVLRGHETVRLIIGELMKNNFGGYLRTKFDQAKKNLQRAEQILYDWKMNRGKNNEKNNVD